jgi:hypothetical protein
MSATKEYFLSLIERGKQSASNNLEQIAKALGGELKGRAVVMPSPGLPPTDRSMVVYFNAANPAWFYIYSYEGPLWMAKAAIRDRLRLVDMPPVEDAWLRTEKAMEIWHQATSAKGTVVERYLKSRAISLPETDVVRFHKSLKHPGGAHLPAMVALFTDVNDHPIAIHRTWLKPDGSSKADVDPQKMTLGPMSGGAIRLSPVRTHLAVGEGIETSLSTIAMQQPAWAAGSANNIAKLELPDEVRMVSILIDRDDHGAGERAAATAAPRWLLEDRVVKLCRSKPPDKDLNDYLKRRR